MAEVVELEVKASVSGAKSEFKELNDTVKESISEVDALNEQLEFKQMRKIKANIVTRTSKIIEHGMHSIIS